MLATSLLTELSTNCYSKCTNMFMISWFESCFRLGVFALSCIFVTGTRFYWNCFYLLSWENLLIANFLVLLFIKSFPQELETCLNLIYFLNILLKCVQLKSSSSFDISVDDICGALRPSLLFPVSLLSWFSFALLGSAIMANFQIYVTSYQPLIHAPHPFIILALCAEASIKFKWMFGQGEQPKPVFMSQFVRVFVRRKLSVATLESVWKGRQICITTDANK